MGFFETGFPERMRARRTQRPRPVTYRDPVTGRAAARVTAGYYWEEIGIRTDVGEAQGLLPSGNNLYAIAQRDILTPALTLQMRGWITEDTSGRFPRLSPTFLDHVDDDPEYDEPIWFSRTIERGRLLDALEPFARGGGTHRQFLDELSKVVGFPIVEVETLRVIPSEYGTYR